MLLSISHKKKKKKNSEIDLLLLLLSTNIDRSHCTKKINFIFSVHVNIFRILDSTIVVQCL